MYRPNDHWPRNGEPQKGNAQKVKFERLIGDLLCNHLFQTSKRNSDCTNLTKRVRKVVRHKRVQTSDEEVCHVFASGARKQMKYGLEFLLRFPLFRASEHFMGSCLCVGGFRPTHKVFSSIKLITVLSEFENSRVFSPIKPPPV